MADARPTSVPVAGARRAVALLLAINLFNYIDRYVLAAVVPRIMEEFFAAGDASVEFWTGLLATAFLLSYMLVSPLFGWLADRGSRWRIIGLGVIAWSLASGGSGLATTYLALLLTRLAVGVGEGAYGPAAPTIIADLYPVERRGRVLAWFYLAIPVGSALGYALGGAISAAWGWRWAFYLSVPPGIALGVWALLLKDPPRGAADPTGVPQRTATWRDFATFLRTPSYVYNTLGMAAMTFALGGIAYWMPEYVHNYRGEPNLAQVNLVFGGLTAVSGLVATLLGGLAGDALRTRYGGSYFLVSGVGMLLGLPLFLASLFVPFPAAWGLIFLAEFCLFFNTGPTNTILANVTHPALRASGYAFNIFLIHLLGDAISPPLIGWVARACADDQGRANMNAGFALVSLAILASGVFWLVGARHLARDTAAAPHRLDAAAGG